MGSYRLRRLGIVLLLAVALVGLGVTVVSANVEVTEEETSATMVGYGENAQTDVADHPNAILIEGRLTFTGEDAVAPEIRLESAPNTVVDTSSAEMFVDSGQPIDFTKRHGPDVVRFSAEEITEGTTIQFSYVVYFTGGTTNSEITAGTVDVSYETEGGTSGSDSFEVTVDASNSADNEIDRLQTGQTIGGVQEILSYVGGAAVILIPLFFLVWFFVLRDGGNGDGFD